MTVSLVMPSYNTAAFIGDAIRSVQRQSFQDWKLIIVDDGSQDNTVEVVKTYLSDPRIEFHQQKNAGSSVARNWALSRIDTEFVGFLDSDDLWRVDKIETHLRVLKDHPQIGVTFSGWQRIDERSNKFGREHKPESKSYSAADFLQGQGIATTSLVIARMEALKQVQFFDETIKVVEDLDLWYRVLAQKKYEIWGLPDVLTEYRNREGQITKNISLHREHWQNLMLKVSKQFPEEWRQYQSAAYFAHYTVLVGICYLSGSFVESRRYLKKAFAKRPLTMLTQSKNLILASVVLSTLAPEQTQAYIKRSATQFLNRVIRQRESE